MSATRSEWVPTELSEWSTYVNENVFGLGGGGGVKGEQGGGREGGGRRGGVEEGRERLHGDPLQERWGVVSV